MGGGQTAAAEPGVLWFNLGRRDRTNFVHKSSAAAHVDTYGTGAGEVMRRACENT